MSFHLSRKISASKQQKRAVHGANEASNRLFGGVVRAGLLCALLSGCAVGKSLDQLASEPELVTGSVAEAAEAEGVDPTDAETIKLAVADATPENADSNLLAWSNPETGNSGTIMAIDKYIGTHGQSCKKFRTTVDSFMGISLYKGETCELKRGFWVLSWFIREKSE